MSFVVNVDHIPDLLRMESVDKNDMLETCMERTHAVYPHKKMFGEFCNLTTYIDCPPDKVFEYLSDGASLLEWSYSVRELKDDTDADILEFIDIVGDNTKCFCKTVTNKEAGTIDYHCSWDQKDHLWMIYLMRVVDAELVLNKPGTVVTWTNCYHPFYAKNPFPETAPADRKVWVGDSWPFFYAGHSIELDNIKKIMEYRHLNNEA